MLTLRITYHSWIPSRVITLLRDILQPVNRVRSFSLPFLSYISDFPLLNSTTFSKIRRLSCRNSDQHGIGYSAAIETRRHYTLYHLYVIFHVVFVFLQFRRSSDKWDDLYCVYGRATNEALLPLWTSRLLFLLRWQGRNLSCLQRRHHREDSCVPFIVFFSGVSCCIKTTPQSLLLLIKTIPHHLQHEYSLISATPLGLIVWWPEVDVSSPSPHLHRSSPFHFWIALFFFLNTSI